MGQLLDKYSTKTETKTSSGWDYEKLKAQGFSDEFLKSKWVKMPKTGIGKILEDAWKRWEAKWNLSNWSSAGIIPAALKWAINIPSNVAKFWGIAGEYLTSKAPWLADFSLSIRKAWDKASNALRPTGVNEWIDNFQKWNGINPEWFMSKLWEEVPAFVAWYWVEKLAMKWIVSWTPIASNWMKILAEKFPWMAKYIPWARTAKFATWVAKNTAQGAWMDIASQWELGLGTALWAVLGTAGAVYGATVDAIAPALSKSWAIKNLLGKVWLKNLSTKMSSNYWLAKHEVEEWVNKVSDFINNNIQPWKAEYQIQQLTELGGNNKKALTEIIDTVSSSNPPEPTIPEAMDMFQRLKLAVLERPTLFKEQSKALSDILKRADNMTTADLQKLKETADSVYSKLFKPNGEVSASLDEIWALRQNIRKEIERQAEMASPWLGQQVNQLNKDIAMSNGIAESAHAELSNRIVWDRLKVMFGVAPWMAALGAYPMSKITGIPLDSTMWLITNSVLAMVTMKLGNSVQTDNAYTSKMAKNLYNRLGKKSVSVLDDYIKNGGQAGLAKKIIKKVEGWLLEMPKPWAKYTKYGQAVPEWTTMTWKPWDSAIINASKWPYNPNQMFK